MRSFLVPKKYGATIACRTSVRLLTGGMHKGLKQTIEDLIPSQKEQLKSLVANHGSEVVDNITVNSVVGGMRGNRSMLWLGSTLDPNLGIKFRGRSIQECQKLLPGAVSDHSEHREFLPEAMLWLLLTGEVPTQHQVNELVEELAIRGDKLPDHITKIIESLPADLHPMTQLAISVAALNRKSRFRLKYEQGLIGKNDYWHYVYEDVLDLIAYLPKLIGKIYSKVTNENLPLGSFNVARDWSYNISSLMGMTHDDSVNKPSLTVKQSDEFVNLVRLYAGIHSDHEGGNVSAHATHLIGSALSDPYLSYSAGIMGLAGPLHGLAAQEVVSLLVDMSNHIDSPNNEEQIVKYLWNLLNSNRVIPGYGHGALRRPDPRFDALLRFTDIHQQEFKNDKLVQLMKNLSHYVPNILSAHGKVKNPFPNVDSASGVLFKHYGLHEMKFITVIFAGARSMGPLSQLIWDRILTLPIERPKSVDIATLRKMISTK